MALAGSAMLGACVPAGNSAPPASAGDVPVVIPGGTAGLDRVLGQDEAGLVRLFGRPDADVREGTARKLQFASRFCVLDAYLYPKGTAVPRVTYVDARETDGSAIDRASCVAALTRREGGR